MPQESKIALFRRLFVGRPDVYAERMHDKKGYVPRRLPRYRLTDSMILRHMRGETMLGAYPMMPDATCHWIAADFDGDNKVAFRDAELLARMLRECGLDPFCNTSQSGKGVHVRLLFEEPQPAWLARRLILAMVEECALESLNNGGAYDRAFPAQDRLNDDKAIGNQIAMPLNRIAMRERGGSMILDENFQPIEPGKHMWRKLESTRVVSNEDIVDALSMIRQTILLVPPDFTPDEVRASRVASVGNGRQPEEHRRQYVSTGQKRRAPGPVLKQRQSQVRYLIHMVRECLFFRYAETAFLSYFEWIALAANLAPFDVAGGREVFHSISAGDHRYEEQVADSKYDNVVSTMMPVRCETIAAEGWRCPKMGGDGQCNKFRNRSGKGPRAPAAIAAFVD